MSTPSVVVLLEGQSDVAAVRALLRQQPVDPDVDPDLDQDQDPDQHQDPAQDQDQDQLVLVDMGGVTNIRRYLSDLVGAPLNGDGPLVRRVLGLCDAGEASFFARALESVGCTVASRADMAVLGFHVCDEDLEDELIRALGAERVIEVLGDLRLLDRFATFRRQPTWTGRPVTDQLRRFAGTTSGRKELAAEALAAAMGPEQVPPPLASLVAQIRVAAADLAPGPAVRPFPRETVKG